VSAPGPTSRNCGSAYALVEYVQLLSLIERLKLLLAIVELINGRVKLAESANASRPRRRIRD
jgi:hypothetical protein